MGNILRFKNYLNQPIGGEVLGLFRLCFGLLMAYEMIDYIKIDLVKNMFVLPRLNFKYDGLEWLKPMSEPIMDGLVYVLLGLTILITIGIWFRWAARLFAIGYAYIFLIDKSIYNNHIYLFILIALLLSCTNADQFISLRKKTITNIMRWEQFIIQFQMVIVYFFAGLIKLKYDWFIRQEPMRTALSNISNDHWLAPVFKTEVFLYFVTYFGVALDFFTPVLLWYKPLRRYSIPLFVAFHLTNTQIFDDIGIFPITMLCSLIIFFEVSELGWLKKWVTAQAGKRESTAVGAPGSLVWPIFVAYFTFQLLFPFRGYFLPNDMDWTTIGNRFGWRVKPDTRMAREIRFQAIDYEGQPHDIQINTYINSHQMNMLMNDPRCVRELALTIAEVLKKQSAPLAGVKARIQMSYNGKPIQYFISPDVDLTKVVYSPWVKLDWVLDKK